MRASARGSWPPRWESAEPGPLPLEARPRYVWCLPGRARVTSRMDSDTSSWGRFAEILTSQDRRLTGRPPGPETARLTEQLLTMLTTSMDVASDSVFWMDSAARFVYVNASACRSVGYSSDELLGMTLYDINPDATPAVWSDLLDTIRRTGAFRGEGRHRRKDGVEFPVEILSTHIRLDGQEFVNGFARDISDRKASEAALRRRVDELSALQSTVLDITSPHELPDVLATIVERAAHLLGADGTGLYLCDPSARQVRLVVDFHTPRDYVGTVLAYGEGASGVVAQTGEPVLVADYRAWAGRATAFAGDPIRSVLAVPMRWQDEVTGVIVAIRTEDPRHFTHEDVELLTRFASHAAIARENARLREGLQQELLERRRAEEARLDLERRMLSAQKLEGLGLLAGGVAHDFNNMLAVIAGYAELLRDRFPEGSEEETSVREILATAERSRNLTRQLLAIGQRQALEMKPLDLNRVIRGAEPLLRRTLRESTRLVVRAAPDLRLVMADAGQVEQVILNLAANAQDAMPREGTLTIETANVDRQGGPAGDASPEGGPAQAAAVPGQPYGRCVLLSVSDTGQGMAPETLSRIFEPFFSTKGEGRGTGLGLPTVYGIVKQHGGSIEASSAPGSGTTLRILLPATDQPMPTEAPRAAAAVGGTETVLIVEDQDQLRGLVCRLLERRGYAVLAARDAAAALDLCARHGGPIHLLVTDVVLEGMNGRDLHDRLARERPATRVLYMSGYPRDILSGQGLLDAEADLVQKPFSLASFAQRVRQALDRPER